MSTEENKIDFLAIGDIVVDAFIKLKDAHVHCKIDNDTCELCVRFGDKVPYDEVIVVPAVGNAANAAVSASRLGLSSALVTNLGNDRDGEECIASLKKDGVNTDFVKVNNGMKTNYHYVLWYVPERTILIKHEKYAYELGDIKEPKWIYFSSVSESAFPFHNTVADYLDNHKDVKLAFQPGKNEIKLGKEKLEKLYKRSDIFFCNVEEARKILGIDVTEIKELLKSICNLGPKIAVITDGPEGAYAYDGNDYLFIPIYPDPKPPYDRTGAGDAFSSTIVSAIIAGKTLNEALAWAGVNSMSVIREIGAQKGLLTREELEKYLASAPAEYKVKNIN